MSKWILTGDRRLGPEPVWLVLDAIRPTYLVVGDCRGPKDSDEPMGADFWAWEWAAKHDVDRERFVAYWARFGLGAGPERNGRMLRSHRDAAGLIALPRGGPGTRDCIKQARGLGMLVLEHTR